MKKLIFGIALALFSTSALAGGEYDGIWEIPGGLFATVNQNGSSLAFIILNGQLWEAQLGTISGNEATVSTVIGYVNLTARVVFNSQTSAMITILSCTDTIQGVCLFSAGTQVQASKIF